MTDTASAGISKPYANVYVHILYTANAVAVTEDIAEAQYKLYNKSIYKL